MSAYGPRLYFGPLDTPTPASPESAYKGAIITCMTHTPHPDGEAVTDDLHDLVEHLSPLFGPQGLATRRSVDADEVAEAYRALPRAKRRVRVYSAAGWVPTSYRYPCDIQYVEATRRGDRWEWSLGWEDARRPDTRATTVVVR